MAPQRHCFLQLFKCVGKDFANRARDFGQIVAGPQKLR